MKVAARTNSGIENEALDKKDWRHQQRLDDEMMDILNMLSQPSRNR